MSCIRLTARSLTAGAAPADYFVDSSMADDTGNGLTAGTAKKYISSGMALMSGQTGKICQVASGTYANASDLLNAATGSGSAAGFNTLRAATAGGVTITAGLDIPVAATYLIFSGLRWENASQKVVEGTYLKFLLCAFKLGSATGNSSNLSCGTNDVAADSTNHILFEDCLWFGVGGRYKLQVYQSKQIIVRRGVFRHDAGWNDEGSGNPEACVVLYNSNNCSLQNCICLDNTLTYVTLQGLFYAVHNSASSGTSSNNSWRGCMVVNSIPATGTEVAGLRYDGNGAQTSHVITDFASWDTNWGINCSYASAVDLDIDRFTLGKTTRAVGVGIAGSSPGTKTIKNGIIKGFNTDDVADVSVTYVDTYDNGGVITGTGVVTYNPQTNGLDQLDKITAASTLKTAGSSGGQIGAEIQKQWGTSGTQHGETGWDTLSSTDLWPFPNQALWKTCLQEDAITRGLAGYGGTLTEYIQGYI